MPASSIEQPVTDTTQSTFWNGEPAVARRVRAKVADAEFQHYWARGFVGEMRDAVEVVYRGHTFYLDDEAYEAPDAEVEELRALGIPPSPASDAGAGWWKVTSGKGAPQVAHRSLWVVPGSVVPR